MGAVRMGELSPGQVFGAEFLAARRVAGIFDGPGYGKSPQYIRAADMVARERVTILCPPSPVTKNQQLEYEKWSILGLPVSVLQSGKDEIPKRGVVICNYVLAGRPDVAKRLRKAGCGALILDEAHHLKNPKGVRTKAVFSAQGIASTADKIWFSTGSPTPNNASEYYVFAKVSGAFTGTYNQFVQRYCLTSDSHFGLKITGSNPATRAELLASLEPYAIRRTQIEDGRGALSIDSALVDGAAPDYSEIEPEHLEAIRAAVESGNWRALDGSAVATVRRITGIAAAKGVAELARAAIDAGHRQVLIFGEHTAAIDIMAAELSDLGVGVIDGRTKEALRNRIAYDFSPENMPNVPQFRVAIAQRMALKEGVTMTGATRVLLAEPSWTPEDNWQMIARASRRGQLLPVHASFVRLPGSIYDQVIATNARKVADIASLQLKSPN